MRRIRLPLSDLEDAVGGESDADPSSDGFGVLTHQGEPESAVPVATARSVFPPETVEEPGQVALFEVGSRVRDRDPIRAVRRLVAQRDDDRCAERAVLDGVVEEVDEVLEAHGGRLDHETITDMPYLEACIKEALRIFPPVSRNDRMCTKDWHDNGLFIPEGPS